MRKFIAVLMIFGVFISSTSVFAYQAYPENELTEKVDKVFKVWDKQDSPGMSIGIIKDGRLIYARGYGMANLEYDIPNTSDTVFRTGSVAKQFTAMCIALLADQGKLSPDDNVRKIIPEMPEYDKTVTIRHLVHHISGVRDYLNIADLSGLSEADYYTNQDVLDMITRQKELNFKPGDEYLYSNSGYFLLAEIVSRASGMPATEFAKKFIFEPLGMNNTHFHDNRNLIVKNRADGYSPAGRGKFRINMTQLEMIGDGGVYTTINDMLKWDNNLYNNKLGSNKLMGIYRSTGKLNNGEDTGYAFGIGFGNYRGLNTFGHGGSFVGFRAANLQFPEFEFSVVILANTSAVNPSGLCRRVADIYLEEHFAEPAVSGAGGSRNRGNRAERKYITIPENDLRKYTGEYYSEELDFTYLIELKDGALKFMHRNAPKAEIKPVSKNEFYCGYLRIEFENNMSGFSIDAGRVKHLKFKKK